MGGPQMRMLSGFNHNIRFRGKVYHVQTEDGGKDNPQIITHAFQGGAILDSVRTSYADLLGLTNWQADLKDRMKAQHLEEIRRLMSGDIVPPEGDPEDRGSGGSGWGSSPGGQPSVTYSTSRSGMPRRGSSSDRRRRGRR